MKIFVSMAGPERSSINPIELALKTIMEANPVIQIVNSLDETDLLLTDDLSQALRFLKDGDDTKVLIATLPGKQGDSTRSGAESLARSFVDRVYSRPLVEGLGEQNIVFFLLTIQEEMK